MFFMGELSSIKCQLQPPQTVVLDDSKCINSGKIIKGNVFGNNKANISDVNSQPINGSCPAGWALLEPGVLVLIIFVNYKMFILLNKLNF